VLLRRAVAPSSKEWDADESAGLRAGRVKLLRLAELTRVEGPGPAVAVGVGVADSGDGSGEENTLMGLRLIAKPLSSFRLGRKEGISQIPPEGCVTVIMHG